MSDIIDKIQLLELKNKNLNDEVIYLKDENKVLKDQTVQLNADNNKLRDANKLLTDRVCDLADKSYDLDRENQNRILREKRKEEEEYERKRLSDLVKQQTTSRLPVLQHRELSEKKTGFRNGPANSNRLSSARNSSNPSAPNNNGIHLPPITDGKPMPGGKKLTNLKRFEEGASFRGRNLVLPEINNATGFVPPSSGPSTRRTKPAQEIVNESAFAPRPPEARSAKMGEFVFKRSRLAVPRSLHQNTASTPTLAPRTPAPPHQAKKTTVAFVFKRPFEPVAVPRSKPVVAEKPVIVAKPAPETTEFIFKKPASPVAAPRSVPNRH